MRLNNGNNKGQAVLELAILGSIILMLFVWMIGIGQNINASQAVTMHSFRKAQELARNRSVDHGKLGSVTFTTIASMHPVNPMNTKGSSSDVTGSGSVIWENELFAFSTADEEDELDKDDAPISFYQIGNDMIKKNTAYIWPRMRVKRKSQQKEPRDYKGWFFKYYAKIFNAISELEEGDLPEDEGYYWVYEPQPSWDQVRTASENYNVDQESSQTAGKARFREKSKNEVVSTTTFKLLPKKYIKQWDKEESILDITHFSSYDVVVTQKETLKGEKEWTASVK